MSVLFAVYCNGQCLARYYSKGGDSPVCLLFARCRWGREGAISTRKSAKHKIINKMLMINASVTYITQEPRGLHMPDTSVDIGAHHSTCNSACEYLYKQEE